MYTGKGISYHCSKPQTVQNVIGICESLEDCNKEQVAAALLKNKMAKDQIESGKLFRLSTDGNPLIIIVGSSDLKSKRKPMKQISFQTIMELSTVLELSGLKTKKLCSSLRRSLGNEKVVESNILKKMESLHDELDNFYESKTEEFISGNEVVIRDMVYVKNTSEFIRYIIDDRGLDIHDALVRISLDGGQNFLKVIVNIFDPNNKHSTSSVYDDSGVKRCFILAIVEDVSEDNGNLQKVLDPLKLGEVDYSLAFDMKCGNSVMGISSHAGRHACLYCEGECTLEPGNSRTLGSLDFWYNQYASDGCPKSRMKEYKNVIKPRLVYLDDDPELYIEHIIPPPELHILMGVVYKLSVLLLTLWPAFEKWLKSHYVMMRGYHGTGFDGNNASKLLSLIETLARDIV